MRFADTDAMGHVNNAVYLTYCEMARIRYWTDVTGEPVAAGHEGAESLILAEARITYRAPVFHSETVTVETRATRIGSFVVHARASADGVRTRREPRLVATSDSVMVRYDYETDARAAGPGVHRRDRDVRGSRAALEPSVDHAAEDRDRVLAAEPEAVDGDRLDPGRPRRERHVVEVALRDRACAGWRSAG